MATALDNQFRGKGLPELARMQGLMRARLRPFWRNARSIRRRH
ncbi:hypothetical protein ACFQDZ_16885 [Sulfitobacter pacificus]